MDGMAYVEYETGLVTVQFDYDIDLIEELKAAIPPMDRRWNPNREVWEITTEWWPTAREVIERYLALED